NDRLVAGPNGDSLDGGDGDDTLVAGSGDDTLNPGDGHNLISWQVGDGNTQVADSLFSQDTLQVIGSDASDSFAVSWQNNAILVTASSAARPTDSPRVLSLTGVRVLNLDGGLDSDSFVIGDLSGSQVEQVSVNTGEVLAPDHAVDSIT